MELDEVLTDDDQLVYVNGVLKGKLLENETLIQQAAGNSKEQFANSPDLADALIDAGYEIHVDVAVENMRDSPSELRVPLSTQNAGKPQAGKQYIQSLSFQLQ